MKYSKTEKAEARERLLELLKPGDTVHTILEHVSRSGMMRKIRPVVLRDDQRINLGYSVGALIGETVDNQAVKMSGCGMDMGFSLVYNLSYYLWPQGFECAGEHCRSCDHSNGDRDYSPHHHSDGGYALRQVWL